MLLNLLLLSVVIIHSTFVEFIPVLKIEDISWLLNGQALLQQSDSMGQSLSLQLMIRVLHITKHILAGQKLAVKDIIIFGSQPEAHLSSPQILLPMALLQLSMVAT